MFNSYSASLRAIRKQSTLLIFNYAFFSIFFSIAVLRGGDTKYPLKGGREVTSSGETDTVCNFTNGELGFC